MHHAIKRNAPRWVIMLPCCSADALKFNGPAPEVINCRLAMVGFLYAASNEASSGKLVLEQFQDSPWFPLAFSTIFIWASLVPITKGAKRESFGSSLCLLIIVIICAMM